MREENAEGGHDQRQYAAKLQAVATVAGAFDTSPTRESQAH